MGRYEPQDVDKPRRRDHHQARQAGQAAIKGIHDDEAKAILTAASNLQRRGEQRWTFDAKRWVPWLCAYTGARVGELAQLRKQDVTRESGHRVIRVTPEAGTVKTNEARKIVLHPQIIEQGFVEFVASASNGHLFLKVGKDGDVGPLQGVKNRLAEFARAIVTDPNVAPIMAGGTASRPWAWRRASRRAFSTRSKGKPRDPLRIPMAMSQ